PVIVGSTDTSGWNIDLPGGGGGKSRQAPPSIIKNKVRLDIEVNVPKQPDPTGKVEISDTVTASGEFPYTIGPFVTGKANVLEAGSIAKRVEEILSESLLPTQSTKDIVRIEVHGYASNKDSEERNLKLSKARAEAVIKAFDDAGVDAKVFSKPRPHGEW